MGSLFSSNEEDENEARPDAQSDAQPDAQSDDCYRHVVPNAKALVDKMLKDTIDTIPWCEGRFIHNYFRKIEDDPFDDCLLWDRQPHISQSIYIILIDWLESVHVSFGLRLEVLYLTVSIIVRYMSEAPHDAVQVGSFQSLGVTAMFISSKYEENNYTAPEVEAFVRLTDGSCKRADIIAFEKLLLHTIDFEISAPPTMFPFLCWYTKGLSETQRKEAFFLVETSLLSARLMVSFRSSEIAAAATCIAIDNDWPEQLRHFSGYARKDLDSAIVAIFAFTRSLQSKRETLFVMHKYSKNT